MIKFDKTTTGLLKTKYTLPVIRKQLLSRSTLCKKLDKVLHYKLTVVSAPAGFGKTTAVLKWLEELSVTNAWLSIDSGDNDPFAFWRYFCAALNSILPGISRETDYVFENQELFASNTHLSIIIDRITSLEEHFVLVLDDLHLIMNHDIYDKLAFFISYMPSNLHLIILSRTPPRLGLAKLHIKDELLTISPEDLRFEADEISEYYNMKGYLFNKEELKRIENYTEGWAAALVAVSLSLSTEQSKRSIFDSFGNCSLQIESYLEEDVFMNWTEEQQLFMEKTSVLSWLCGSLCTAVADCDGNVMLSELYSQNSFLIALDTEGNYFRYHHIFLDFLRKRVRKRGPAFIKDLNRKAGNWCKSNGYISEAIEYLLQGEDYPSAVPLVEAQGAFFLRQREFSIINRWIDLLPKDFKEKSPFLTLLKASYFVEIADFTNADRLFMSVENESGSLPMSIIANYWFARANYYLRLGNLVQCLKSIIQANSFNSGSLFTNEYMEINLYDISLYRSMYQMIINMMKTSENAYGAFVKNYRMLIAKNPGYAPLVAGELFYETNRLGDALSKLTMAVEEAVSADCMGALVPAMVTLSRLRRAQGDMNGAVELALECEKRAAASHKSHWVYLVKAFKSKLYIEMHQNEKLDTWYSECRLNTHQDITKAKEYEFIILSRMLIYKKKYSSAIFLLNRLLAFARNQKRLHSSVEILNLLAMVSFTTGDEHLALKYFEEALAIGYQEDYVRSFADELSPMTSLLELYIRKNVRNTGMKKYAAKLLDATSKTTRLILSPMDSDSIEKLLTPAEKRVLVLVIKACSNQAISVELGISLRTVKAHTTNIYKKLGVKTRAQCIRKVNESTK